MASPDGLIESLFCIYILVFFFFLLFLFAFIFIYIVFVIIVAIFAFSIFFSICNSFRELLYPYQNYDRARLAYPDEYRNQLAYQLGAYDERNGNARRLGETSWSTQ